MERVAIYYRVSTDRQELTSQKHVVEKWLADQPKQPKKIYVLEEPGLSGKDNNRPRFREMMDLAMSHAIDTIIVYRLDRFSRDANTAIRTILDLDSQGVAFISVTQPVLNLGHEMPFRRTMLAAFAEIAELERETIVARVRAGLAAAIKGGTKLGAPTKISSEKQVIARSLKAEGLSYKAVAKRMGLSVGSVHALVTGVELVTAAESGKTVES